MLLTLSSAFALRLLGMWGLTDGMDFIHPGMNFIHPISRVDPSLI